MNLKESFDFVSKADIILSIKRVPCKKGYKMKITHIKDVKK